MRNLRILHMGGLELDEQNCDEKRQWLELLLPELKKTEIDHVVVCGSLTRNGNFNLLSEFLKTLDGLVSSRRRIVLAPGVLDPHAGFADFHAKYFNGEFTCPSSEGIDSRRHRDLTVIGSRFDTLSGNAYKEIQGIVGLIHSKVLQWHQESDRRELRVAAMAANPLEAGQPFYSSTQLHFLQQNIDLILCGETGIPLIPVQPYSELPAIVGISSSTIKSPSWNLISLRLPPDPRHPAKARVQFQVKTYEQYKPTESPSFEYSTAGFETTAAQIENVLLCKEKLLPRLDTAWNAGKAALIEVSGYGDVWKDVITDGLQAHGRIGRNEVLIETFRISRYPDGPVPSKWETKDIELITQVAAWHSRLRPNGLIPVALIVDEALIPGDSHDKNRLNEVKKRLVSFFAPLQLRIIYLSSSYGVPLPREARVERIQLDPIAKATLRDFLTRASCELPIRSEDIEHLTGGYVGFVKLLIDELRDHYQQIWKYGSPDDWKFEKAVIQACAFSEVLRKETAVFFEALRKLIPSGHAVSEAFLNVMCEKLLPGADGLEALLEGEVSITESFARKNRLDVGLELLKDLGIVQHRPHQNLFVLMERIPFLVQFARPHGTQVVFLSYDEEDRDRIEELKNLLNEGNIALWEWRDARDVQQGLPAAINARLRSCDIVVVLWTRNSIGSDLVIEEARDAMSVPGQLKLINWFDGVVPASHTPPPEGARSHSGSIDAPLTSPLLTEFSDALGRTSLNEVVKLIKENLLPLPRCAGSPLEAQ